MNNKAINKVNDTFLKIAKEKEDNINTKSLRKNVTARALGAGLTGALIGAQAGIGASIGSGNMMRTAKKYGKAGAAIGTGLLAANSIRKNVKHNRKIDAIDERLNKSAFDIVNESFEKIAGIGVGSDNNLYYYRDHYDSEDKYDNIYDKAREMDIANGQEGYEDNGNAWNAVDNEIYRYINEHPNKQKALDDLEFNIRRNSAKHKHSGKVIKAGALLGAVAPTALAAGTGLALGAINPKLLSTKPQGNIVFPTLSRGAAALKGAKKGALASLYGAQLLGGIPQIAGITAGSGIGNRVAKKMNKKVKDSMGPARLDNFNTIENDLDNHILNPNTQKNIFDNVKYEK